MSRPRRHARQRLAGRPRALVRAIGRDRVIDVADRPHPRMQAELRAGQPVRIAAAVDPFVVVQAHVEDRRRDPVAFDQQRMPLHRMRLHHAELARFQLAWLVEQRAGHRHLADVVQHPGHAQVAHLILRQAHAAREVDEQGAHRHRMEIGVFVLVLQPRDLDDRGRIARDRGGDLIDQRRDGGGVDRIAQPHFRKHPRYRFLRPFDRFAGAIQFGGRTAAGATFRPGIRYRGGLIRFVRCIGDDHGRGRIAGLRRADTAVRVDHDLRDPGVNQLVDLRLSREQELRTPERTGEPAAVHHVDEHPDPRLRRLDLDQHLAPPAMTGLVNRGCLMTIYDRVVASSNRVIHKETPRAARSMTCGTKRAPLPVIRPSSRMPMPAGSPPTTQLPMTGKMPGAGCGSG